MSLPASCGLPSSAFTSVTLVCPPTRVKSTRNVHPKYVQELLGHASISQTLDTYSHVIEGMDGGFTDAVDETLG